MRFLADENFPRPAVEALRAAGFDVEQTGDDQPGAPDEDVLQRCGAKGRVLLTFDKDFGEMAFRRGMPAEFGIILFRVIPESPNDVAEIAVSAIRSQTEWAGHFSVVSRTRIRMTRLPSA